MSIADINFMVTHPICFIFANKKSWFFKTILALLPLHSIYHFFIWNPFNTFLWVDIIIVMLPCFSLLFSAVSCHSPPFFFLPPILCSATFRFFFYLQFHSPIPCPNILLLLCWCAWSYFLHPVQFLAHHSYIIPFSSSFSLSSSVEFAHISLGLILVLHTCIFFVILHFFSIRLFTW